MFHLTDGIEQKAREAARKMLKLGEASTSIELGPNSQMGISTDPESLLVTSSFELDGVQIFVGISRMDPGRPEE